MEYFHRRMAHVPAPAPPGAATIAEVASPDTVPPQSPGPTLDRENAGAYIHEDVDHVSADSGCIAEEGTLSEHWGLCVATSEHFQDGASTGEEPNAETGSTSCLVFESQEIEPSLETELQNVPQSEDTDLDSFQSSSHYRSEALLKWQSVLALLYTSGTVRYTVFQYEAICNLLNWQASMFGADPETLPCYSTVLRKLKPMMLKHSYVASSIESLRARGGGLAKVCIVLPSAWALMDTATGVLYDAMFGNQTRPGAFHTFSSTEYIFEGIEDVPIVRSRSMNLDMSQVIFVDPVEESDGQDDLRNALLPEAAGPGDVVCVTFVTSDANNMALMKKHAVPVAGDGDTMTLTGTIRSVWHVGGDSVIFRDAEHPRAPLPFGSCHSLNAGDIVADIEPSVVDPDGATICSSFVLVYRFTRGFEGGERIPTKQLFVFSQRDSKDGEPMKQRPTFYHIRKIRRCSGHGQNYTESRLAAPCTGVLSDGRRYVVYRVLLYCDDFQPHVSNSNSYGGCYMLPMGIPPNQRSGFGAVRCLGLSPPQMSSNEILQYIVPDLVKSATTGIQGLDPEGNAVTIFIDVLGYIGDYPGISHALDVLGHAARAPCHLCSFLRKDRTGEAGRNYYGYTSSVHSRSTSFARSMDRMLSVRSSKARDIDLSELGFKPDFDITNYPLHFLSQQLRVCRNRIPLTDGGARVVPGIFEPYRSSLVAPDHLLFGLARDILRAMLIQCTPHMRKHAETLIMKALRAGRLGRQRELFNSATATLHQMGMSDVFAVLLLAPACFESAIHFKMHEAGGGANSDNSTCDIGSTNSPPKKQRITSKGGRLPLSGRSAPRGLSLGRGPALSPVTREEVLQLLHMFQQLVAETHLWPNKHTDTAHDFKKFNAKGGFARFNALYSQASVYIQKLHDLSVRDYQKVGVHLNKPNVHRLVELYTHTIPMFGHARHVQELLFETAHQPLKRAISRSNMKDPHVSAVHATLCNDWETRLSIEVKHLDDPKSWTDTQCLRMQRLVAGRDTHPLPQFDRVRSVFCKPVLDELSKVGRKLNSHGAGLVVWKAEVDGCQMQNVEQWMLLSAEQETAYSDAIRTLKCSSMNYSFHPDSIRAVNYASSWNRTALNTNSLSTPDRRRSGIVYPSAVFQAVTANSVHHETCAANIQERSSPVEDATSDGDYSISYWYTLGIFDADPNSITSRVDAQHAERLTYAVVSPCVSVPTVSALLQPMRVDCAAHLSIVQLSRTVRETLVIHACAIARNCDATDPTAIQHAGTLGTGTCFYVLGRRMGYPPRVG
jgi:hypothetical protein